MAMLRESPNNPYGNRQYLRYITTLPVYRPNVIGYFYLCSYSTLKIKGQLDDELNVGVSAMLSESPDNPSGKRPIFIYLM